jgi:hypothetical protein
MNDWVSIAALVVMGLGAVMTLAGVVIGGLGSLRGDRS